MTGWPNRFVRLLRVFDLRLVNARLSRQEILAVFLGDESPSVFDRHLRKVRRIGTHVGNMSVFVQALRDLHRPAGREAKLTVGLLLQRARRKRWVRLRR